MADDIVTRLRTVVAVPNGVDIWTTTALDAADEIDRLRAALTNAVKSITNRERENDELHDDLTWLLQEVGRLRAAGDALAATWPEEERCNCDNADCRAVVAAYDAWQEARRG